MDVAFNLRGRPWTNKEGVTTYFNSLVAWRVTKAATQQAAPQNFGGEMQAPPASFSAAANDDDDLPF